MRRRSAVASKNLSRESMFAKSMLRNREGLSGWTGVQNLYESNFFEYDGFREVGGRLRCCHFPIGLQIARGM